MISFTKNKKSIKIFSAAILMAAVLVPINSSQAATFIASEPILRVGNYSQHPGSNDWPTSVSANAGEIVSFMIYYNNNSGGTANQTKVRLNLPSGQFTSGSISADVWANNASQISGSASVSLNSSQTLTFIPGSVRWYKNCYSSTLSSLPSSQSGSEVVSSSGLNLGDIPTGSIGCVIVRVQAGNIPTGSAPTVTTNSTSNIYQNYAYLNATVNPNNTFTNFWFEYGTNSSLGTTVGSQSVGSGNSSINKNFYLTGLSTNTTYYYRAVASNSYGTNYGGILSFYTGNNQYYYNNYYSQPSITTKTASPVYQNSALLNGLVNPNGNLTSVWFQWGAGTNLNNTTISQSVSGGTSYINYSAALTNLSSNTTYYYRAVASNSYGTNYGTTLSFNTLQTSPIVISQPTTPQVIYVQSSSKTETFPTSLILLTSHSDKETIKAGEELNYMVVYKNTSQQKLSNAVLKITLPLEVSLIGSNPRTTSAEGNNLTYQIGDLGINEEGVINIKVKVNNSVKTNDTLIFVAVMNYLDKNNAFHSDSHFLSIAVLGGLSFMASLINNVGFSPVFLGGLILGLIIAFLIYWFGIRKKF